MAEANISLTFDEWAEKYSIEEPTVKLLTDNGINSISCVKLLTLDLIQGGKHFKSLSLGQTLLLQEAVTAMKHDTPPDVTPAQPATVGETSTATGAAQASTSAGTLDYDALTRIMSSGTQPSATSIPASKTSAFDPFAFDLGNTDISCDKPRDIKDYITLSQTREKQTVTLGGIELTIPEAKPKLESISPLQYMEASLKIMRDLVLKDGADMVTALQYTGYLIKIANMGQRFNWQSVIKYDTEYRKYQAAGQFPWGADNAWTMMMFLKEGLQNKPQYDGSHSSSTRVQDNPRTRYDPKSGKPICDKFNGRQGCNLPACRFAHVCHMCFHDSHGQVSHDGSSVSPRFQSKN